MSSFTRLSRLGSEKAQSLAKLKVDFVSSYSLRGPARCTSQDKVYKIGGEQLIKLACSCYKGRSPCAARSAAVTFQRQNVPCSVNP